MEIDNTGHEQHIIYAERFKSLLSPGLRDGINPAQLPNKVTDWLLCRFLNLVHLAMTRNNAKKDHNAEQEGNHGAETIHEAVRVETTKEHIKWATLQDMTYILQ